MKTRKCFVVMPFNSKLHYFYLFIKEYVEKKYDITVERGDTKILTKPMMDKIRESVQSADIIIGDISDKNPNVFYELGMAYMMKKKIIYITSEDPASAPVDIRQFEFIKYDLENDKTFCRDLDKVIGGILSESFDEYYKKAIIILDQFNKDSRSRHAEAGKTEFVKRIARIDATQGLPSLDNFSELENRLLPAIVAESSDTETMSGIVEWINRER
ncbi:hypothetical protein KQI52_04065 [bacterium]|nr:hypothetical protein [bacterium]